MAKQILPQPQTCRTCRFWNPIPKHEVRAVCRRYPPTMKREVDTNGFIGQNTGPVVDFEDWCGEWKEVIHG